MDADVVMRRQGAGTGSKHTEDRSRSRSGKGEDIRQKTRSRSRDDENSGGRERPVSDVSTLDREGVLAALGYKHSKTLEEPKPASVLDHSELCQRCQKKVYPVEKLDIGKLYHKGCFKCKECGLQLTLQTFYGGSGEGEVHCKKHATRDHKVHIDQDALQIRAALDAQKHASARLREGERDSQAPHYDPDALEFQHARDIRRNKKVRRQSSTLRSWKDFEKFGVFDAQNALEKVHREEEDALYRQMFDERQGKLERLERQLAKEKENTVRELVAWFDKKGISKQDRQAGLKQVDQYYLSQRSERMRLLQQRLAVEEQSAVARMIEKHSEEMLELIADLEEKAEQAAMFEYRNSQISDTALQIPHGGGSGEPYTIQGTEDRGEALQQEAEEEEEEESEEESESFSEQSYTLDEGKEGFEMIPVEQLLDKYKASCKKDKGSAKSSERQPQEPKTASSTRPKEDLHQKPVRASSSRGSLEGRSGQRTKESKRQWKTPDGDGTSGYVDDAREHLSDDMLGTGSARLGMGSTSKGGLPAHLGLGLSGSGKPHHQSDPTLHSPTEEQPPQHRYTDDMYLKPQRPRFSDLEGIFIENETPHEIALRKNNLTGTLSGTKKPVFVYESMASEFHRKGDELFPQPGRGELVDNRWNEAREKQRRAKMTKDLHDAKNRQAQALGQSGSYTGRFMPGLDIGDPDSGRKSGTYSEGPKPFKSKPGADGSNTSAGRTPGRGSLSRHSTPRDMAALKDTGTPGTSPIGNDKSIGGRKPPQPKKRKGGRRDKHGNIIRAAPGEHGEDYSDGDDDEIEDSGDEMATKEGDGTTDEVFHDDLAKPEVVPPENKKAELFTTPEVFKEFDTRAVKETKREHKTFTELVRRLSKYCQTELQKVRAIFRWITAKDLNKIQIEDDVDPDSPMGLLKGIKLGKESYHNLFKRLCSYVGLHCVVIEGYSKGAGYRPGDRFKGNTFRNQWTAVWIEGSWRFINCNWGARHVKGPRDNIMTYKCDEFYFLTDPEEHIYQHFPEEPKWQLLRKPITLQEFVRLPVLKSPFFNHDLSFPVSYSSVLHAPDGSVEIRIEVPRFLNFAGKLKAKDKTVTQDMLEDRVLIRRQDKEVVFTVNLPMPGTYFLEIYVSKSWLNESMNNACAFRIKCTDVSSNAHMSYPPVGAFGRTPHFKSSGLSEESHKDTFISCSGGEVSLAFSCVRDSKISHSLRLWNHRDKQLHDYDRFAFPRYRSDNRVHYQVHCPRRGSYVLSLFSNRPDRPDSDMECVYRYFIECQTAKDNANPFPKASKRWRHCQLIEPMKGELNMKVKIRFKIESERAMEVMAEVNKDWTPLKREGKLWQGVVYTGDQPGKAMVYGRFDSNKDKYIPLLEYQIKGEAGVADQVKALYKYLN